MESEVFNIDCMEYMRALPDKCFALAVADPPYGLPAGSTHGRGKLRGRILNRGNIHRWDQTPGKEFFDELFRVSVNQVIWGGNYFGLPPCRCFVCWDKRQAWENFSQCEYAWTSFDRPAKMVSISNTYPGKIHPTQKPMELYTYLLRTFAGEGDRIFDPMMGSQSSRIAAYRLGLDYAGCEKDEGYFLGGCRRFDEECRGEYQTGDGKIIKQLNLFE